jgi:anhydro-N-acetylmuramic acid kinase
MKRLEELSKKQTKLVIGLMSGTSVDGIDVVLLKVTGNGTNTKFEQLEFETYPFPEGLKEFVLKNSLRDTSNVEDICRLNMLYPQLYAEAIFKLCEKAKIKIADVDLIGNHGQTIHHLPKPHEMFGHKVTSTLQISDTSALAKLTGVITVGNFRNADMALGGQGAPLVPYFDYIIFSSEEKNRGLLNIGGISNMTLLPKKCTVKDVLAFDCGPGNMIIDGLMKKFYGKSYDKDGEIAQSGKLNDKLFTFLKGHEYYNILPPKSTGREIFGEKYIEQILNIAGNIPKEDIIRTATEITSYAIYYNYEKFMKSETEIEELLVSGGGAHNKYMMQLLQKYFGSAKVMKIEEYGYSSDAKEAICFAILANETISGNPANVPRTTGAKEPAILGTISF